MPVHEKKIFEGFLPYMVMAAMYGNGGHLGHVTTIMSSDLHFLVPESFHTNFNSEWPSSF